MDVVFLGPLPVASLPWQPRPGAWMLTFACKATYVLQPIESELAIAQEPIHDDDRHWSNDPAWSVYAPCDLAPIRRHADVVLVGHAFAPNGVPVRSLIARLVAGDIDKSIEVFCDRAFMPDRSLQEGPGFAKMPLLWERAAGGPDTMNPVGVQAHARDRRGQRTLPNLQPPGTVVMSPDHAIEPICFGPVGAAWPARRRRLGRHASTWSDAEWHRHPLPADIDAFYFNAAPHDQQAQALRDDERIVLDNLHPEHAHLATRLPGLHPTGFVERAGKPPTKVALLPDLLWIHTDRGLCTLTWRGQLPLEHPAEAGTVRIALEHPGEKLTWEDIERLSREDGPISSSSQFFDAAKTLAPTAPGPARDGGDNPLDGTLAGSFAVQSAADVLPFAGAPPPSRSGAGPSSVAGTPFAPASVPGRSGSGPSWSAVGPVPAAAPPSQVAAAPAGPPPVAAPPPAAPPVMAPPPVAPPPVAPPAIIRAPLAAAPPLADGSWPSASTPARPATIGESAVKSTGAASPADHAHGAAGALAASNAAAAVDPWSIPRGPAPAPPAAVPLPARPVAPAPEIREVLHLVWYDPDSVRRIRRQPSWHKILEGLDQKPLDNDLDDPSLAREPMDVEDRRDVFEVLAKASAIDAEGIDDALASAVRDDGKYVPQLRLVAGDLVFPFDELETLKVTITAVTPLIGNDEALRAAVTAAQDYLKLPDVQSAPASAAPYTVRIREAYAQGKRAVSLAELEAQIERALLEQRCYQRRKVFGKPHLRALLAASGDAKPVPIYLPAGLAEALPMYARFRSRAIVEVNLQVDQYESHAAALRTLALARAAPAPVRR